MGRTPSYNKNSKMPNKKLKKKRKDRPEALEGRIHQAILRGFRATILKAFPTYKGFIRRRKFLDAYEEVLEVHSPRHCGPVSVRLTPDGGSVTAWKHQFPLADPKAEEFVLETIRECFDQPRGALWGKK